MAETLNPIPVCEHCGKQTSRAGTTASKGRYCCTNNECPFAFKKWYIRGSRKSV